MSTKSISIHSLRMEGDFDLSVLTHKHCISIHSLRMEGDGIVKYNTMMDDGISIHSLRMEGDVLKKCPV